MGMLWFGLRVTLSHGLPGYGIPCESIATLVLIYVNQGCLCVDM